MDIRRVITGRTAEGRSVIVEDALVPELIPQIFRGSSMHRVWGSDAPVALPSDGTIPAHQTFFPETPGGMRVVFSTVPPDSDLRGQPVDLESAVREAEEIMPGVTKYSAKAHQDHSTPTVDIVCIVFGKIELQVGDASPITLRPGDIVIQNGTSHRWFNPYDQPCTFLGFMAGAAESSD